VSHISQEDIYLHRVDVFMNKGKPIAVNEYHFLKTIGQGSFAEVKMATKLEDEFDQTM
jgi:hypothetical protein